MLQNDSRDSARALGLDDEYLSRVEEQRRQREEMRRRRDRNEGNTRNESTNGANRELVTYRELIVALKAGNVWTDIDFSNN